MVLPKPWQRGHAPMGLLKLNSAGSGVDSSISHCLHENFSLKRRVAEADSPGGFFENHLARFAIADLGGVHQALVQIGGDDEAVHQDEERLVEIDIQQRFRAWRTRTPGRSDTGG